MPKRPGEELVNGVSLKGGERPMDDASDEMDEAGAFEDQFEDEFESEDEILEAGVDGRPDAEREAEERAEARNADPQTFIVGRHKLEPGQTLAPDLSAYDMYYALSTPWPCLSFDILPDELGDDRKTYPATMYAVAGTQAESGRAEHNKLMVMKFSGLSRMERSQEDSDDASDDDDEDSDPILESSSIPLTSATNRIRAYRIPADDSSQPSTTLAAIMTESSQVLIHNITPHLGSFDTPTMIRPEQNEPLATLGMHRSEGYGIDWSPVCSIGKLATGDNDGNIFITTQTNGASFVTDDRPFTGHAGSIEEIQWSPTEANVFATASSDGIVKIWDVRSRSRRAALSVRISDRDVNVMSWSRQSAHLLASGADDGVWAVWDLRQWRSGSGAAAAPVASFDYHKQAITSIEWHPRDDSIVAVAAGDDTLTLWDLAVELDDEESRDTGGVAGVPSQLLFVHYLEAVKELHWHRQIPGCVVATGSQFNVFKTISV